MIKLIDELTRTRYLITTSAFHWMAGGLYLYINNIRLYQYRGYFSALHYRVFFTGDTAVHYRIILVQKIL